MQGLPNIILTCSYSFGKNYKAYFNYMTRKEALDHKKELSEKEKAERERITNALKKQGYFQKITDDKTLLKSTDRDKAKVLDSQHKLLTEDEFNQIYNEDYGKYLGYMVRRQAIASKKKLTEKDREEMARIGKAMDKMQMPADASKLLIDVWTDKKDTMTLGDRKEFQDKMQDAKKAGSMLWTDVVSFDNRFLERQGLYNPETGELKSEALRVASRKMLDTLAKREGLDHPFWLASVHRNTDNIHIHFAIMEERNSRPMVDVGGQLQPRGNFKQSTIYAMKSAFANELVDISMVQEKMTKERSRVREAVYESAKKSMEEPDFRARLNAFVKKLPKDRRKWKYGTLKRFEPDLAKELDDLTDELLKDDPHFKEYKGLATDLDKFYQEQYGKTKNEHKHYAENQLKDIKKRAANKLLSSISELDLAKGKIIQRAEGVPNPGEMVRRHKKGGDKEESKRKTKRRAGSGIQSKYLDDRKKKHKALMDKLEKERKQRREMELMLRKNSIDQMQNTVQKEFDNGLTSYEKLAAMREFAKWQNMESDR